MNTIQHNCAFGTLPRTCSGCVRSYVETLGNVFTGGGVAPSSPSFPSPLAFLPLLYGNTTDLRCMRWWATSLSSSTSSCTRLLRTRAVSRSGKSTEGTQREQREQRAQREVRRTSSTFLHVRRTLLTFHFALLFHGPFHLLHPLHQQPPFLPARVLPRGRFLCLCLFLCFGLCHPFLTLLLHRVSDFPCFSFRVQCCDQQPPQQVSQTQSTTNNCHHHQTRPTTATTTQPPHHQPTIHHNHTP